MMNINKKVAIIGLGYVGLPLLIYTSKKYKCIGYDINKKVIEDLAIGKDDRNILSKKELKLINKISVTNEKSKLKDYNVYIVTVPTPIDNFKNPDLSNIIRATELIAKYIKINDLVIYESTVYPGVTEEICVPIIEKKSNFKLNKEFYCGYSPERVNPGDAKRTIDKIIKVTSGSNDYAAKEVDKLYKSIIPAGTFKAKSIKVAEMSKVIENTQRDLNIGLMNEVALISQKLGIKTKDVLMASKSKWNFLDFYPGLVGGHCISVDPYYLTYKSKKISYKPDLILAARRINDKLSEHIANQFIKGLKDKKIKIKNSNIIIFGGTFKENVSDIRNSKIFEIIKIFLKRKINVKLFDPLIKKNELNPEFKKIITKTPRNKYYDGIIYAVDHKEFKEFNSNKIKKLLKTKSFVYDIKSTLSSSIVDQSL